ncbi:hypothetical protein [Pseudoxanthomonas sp. CF125]|uniref:hypothetical protein n=1 Tax=Pseudoxanthomonas sp. CF125 TaxID=1855303 RepID=UPI00088E9A7E|nr:hypothetical protein [Pseudoxanthomonas sp. CF125]SDR06497.1 hypothetical protein SAMN05216569_2899 [Pseudoxanthomonas sp. CF125]
MINKHSHPQMSLMALVGPGLIAGMIAHAHGRDPSSLTKDRAQKVAGWVQSKQGQQAAFAASYGMADSAIARAAQPQLNVAAQAEKFYSHDHQSRLRDLNRRSI